MLKSSCSLSEMVPAYVNCIQGEAKHIPEGLGDTCVMYYKVLTRERVLFHKVMRTSFLDNHNVFVS